MRTDAPVERVLTATAASTGVALVDGEEMSTDTVVTAVHPQIGFLRHLDPAELPDDFVADIRRWRSRGGDREGQPRAVRAARLRRRPRHDLQPHHTGAIELATHSTTSSRRSRTPAPGRPRPAGRSATACIPSTLDPTLCPEGTHVMSPVHAVGAVVVERGAPRDELEAYADRVIAATPSWRPTWPGPDPPAGDRSRTRWSTPTG